MSLIVAATDDRAIAIAGDVEVVPLFDGCAIACVQRGVDAAAKLQENANGSGPPEDFHAWADATLFEAVEHEDGFDVILAAAAFDAQDRGIVRAFAVRDEDDKTLHFEYDAEWTTDDPDVVALGSEDDAVYDLFERGFRRPDSAFVTVTELLDRLTDGPAHAVFLRPGETAQSFRRAGAGATWEPTP